MNYHIEGTYDTFLSLNFKLQIADSHMATEMHLHTHAHTHMPFPITHIIPVIPVPWLLLVQSRVGRKRVTLSGCTFSSSPHMTAVPSDITAAEEWRSSRQWSMHWGPGSFSRDAWLNQSELLVEDTSAEKSCNRCHRKRQRHATVLYCRYKTTVVSCNLSQYFWRPVSHFSSHERWLEPLYL